MSEPRLPIRIACSGLEERDIFVVKSLLRIIDGRRNFSWRFQESGRADIVITRPAVSEADKLRLEARCALAFRIILALPESLRSAYASEEYAVRYPLRASELLERFDQLERDWPFASSTKTEKIVSVSRVNVCVPIAPVITQSVFAQPATVGALMNALRDSHVDQSGQLQRKYIDVYDGSQQWIGRLWGGVHKVYASSRFMLDHVATDQSQATLMFRWKYTPSRTPPITPGDTLIEVDLDIFAWQIASRFCRSFDRLDVPARSTLRLKRWPDFGVRQELSGRHGILLATALLTRQPMMLDELREESGADEADLAYLLAACWLCGWLRCEIQMEKEGDSQFIEPEVLPEKKRFSGIVRSLRKVLGLTSGRERGAGI